MFGSVACSLSSFLSFFRSFGFAFALLLLSVFLFMFFSMSVQQRKWFAYAVVLVGDVYDEWSRQFFREESLHKARSAQNGGLDEIYRIDCEGNVIDCK